MRLVVDWCCRDCGVNTYDLGEYYMVNNDLWAQLAPQKLAGLLCVGCLENRIGRELVAADFTDARINSDAHRRSARLRNRLSLTVAPTTAMN